MDKVSKVEGDLQVKGSDGKVYYGFFKEGRLFTKVPGWVRYVGWRRRGKKEPQT